ncbi:expressed unknown protein [Seminavis robusta]|uniref:Kinesin motor domain-containing protein n=1 Tax=Seminavis robusta TaxID=568900 RepID=A0A9N8H3V9_9STRA|nr:expressed unknown protein [Seminavis robusta]|eukprot:Sro70_g039000.1 n/a (961) ;mRNA; f:80247-83129
MAPKHNSDNKHRNYQADHVSVKLESVLRLRPLLKKEKGDQVVLEPCRVEDGRPQTAVLHPMIAVKQTQYNESPAMKMLSTETLHLCKDTEYHLDQIIGEECDQEKVYYSIGLPIARESMDMLKLKKGYKGSRKTCNLIVCMGVENSGKTHTCFGAGSANVSRRRCPEDGMVPRILDSLFSQSKHHVKSKQSLTFGIKISLIQVTQERTEQPKHDDDSVVHDLLSATPPKITSPMRSASPSRMATVKNLVATLERTRAKVMIPSSSAQSEALVIIEQDESMDFVSNAVVKTVNDVSEARQLIASGLQNGQRFTSRHKKSHVLAILQPVLLGSDGTVEREGGKIGILDMAGIEQSSQKKRNTAIRRHKDSVGASCSGQNDTALNAVLHCVRSLQHNSMILSGKTPALDIVDDAHNGMTIDDNASEISCVSEEKTGKAKGPSFKIVPYRQHNLTMLLQPFFSSGQTSSSKLTLLMAAYPGHRDHAEKKSLLSDLELLFEVSRDPEVGAALTGCEKRPLSPIHEARRRSSSWGDDENVEPAEKPSEKFEKALREESPLPSAPSFQDDEDVVPLPPPYAPRANIQQPPPSAPMVVDFPGVVLPASSENDNTYNDSSRGVMGNPLDADRSFENKPPPNYTPSYGNYIVGKRMTEPMRESDAHNIKRPEEAPTHKTESSSTKAWLYGFSDTTKGAISQATKKGMKMIDKMGLSPERPERTEAFHPNQPPSAEKPTNTGGTLSSTIQKPVRCEVLPRTDVWHSASVSTRPATKRSNKFKGSHGENTVSQREFKKLERQNKELLSRNEQLDDRCAALELENRELKRALEATGRKKGWSKEDEEEWNNKRRQFAAPPLIQSPLNQHLQATQRVFNTTGRYNFAVGQPHFTLQYPSYFRRASDLDRRDREESEKMTSEQDPQTEQTSESGEKRKEAESETKLKVFAKQLEKVKRRRSSLIPGVREREGGDF